MGGINDDGPPIRHGAVEALKQNSANLLPRPLHHRITKQLCADGIGGEHQGGLPAFSLQ